MPITVQCVACKTRLKVRDKAAGKTVKCPKCFGPIEVPTFISGPVVNRVVRKTPLFDEPDMVITGEEPVSSQPREEPTVATKKTEEPPPPRATAAPVEETAEVQPEGSEFPIKVEVEPEPVASAPQTTSRPAVTAPSHRVVSPEREPAHDRAAQVAEDLRKEFHAREENPYESPLATRTTAQDEAVAWDADPPWEAKMSIWSFFATGWAVLVHPLQTFGNLPTTENWRAVWYNFFGQALMIVSLYLHLVGIVVTDVEFLKESGANFFAVSGTMLAIYLGVAFVGAFVFAVLWAWIFHLGLRTTGTLSGDFEATLRVTCYSNGAWSTLYSVPLAGAIAGLLVGTILWPIPLGYLMAGAAKAHGISVWRSLLGFLIALVYWCLLSGAISILILLFLFVG